jgi:type 2 lantibiotic (TIGR03893 family)
LEKILNFVLILILGIQLGKLSVDEMMNIQGAGDVQPETTPTTTIASSANLVFSECSV